MTFLPFTKLCVERPHSEIIMPQIQILVLCFTNEACSKSTKILWASFLICKMMILIPTVATSPGSVNKIC